MIEAQQARALRTRLIAAVLLCLVLAIAVHAGAHNDAAVVYLLVPILLLGTVPVVKRLLQEEPFAEQRYAPVLPFRFQRPPPSSRF